VADNNTLHPQSEPPPEPQRPDTTMDALRARHSAAVEAWVAGLGPAHILRPRLIRIVGLVCL
jgi:hypothetical protein